MKIQIDKKGNPQVEVNKFNFVVYVRTVNYEGFALKYKVGNVWQWQHLMLGCRAGAKNYFDQAKKLYNYIKKEKLTDTTFRRLAV